MSPSTLDVVTIVVALVGGVPGIIATIDHLRKRPRLRLKVVSYVTGQLTTPDRRTRTLLTISVTAANASAAPIMPDVFDLVLEVNGARLAFE